MIAGISYPSDTTYIDLSDRQLNDADIKNIPKLKKLTIVLLNNNSIFDLSPFAELSELEGIWVNNNKITSLSPLKGLKNLKYISVEDNNIESLSPLSGTTKLEQLWCGGNPISGMKNLESLYASYCGLTSISEIKNLKKLSYIEIGYNYLDSVSVLTGCGKITELYLSGNCCSDKETFLKSFEGITLAQDGTIWLEEQNFEWESESEITDRMNAALNVSGTGEYYYAI